MKKYLKSTTRLLIALSAIVLTACNGDNAGVSDGTSASLVAQPRSSSALRKTVNPLDSSTPIHIAVALNLRDSAGLDKFIEEIQTPSHPNYRKTLTPDEIKARFGPTDGQVKAVTSFLEARGFANIKAASNNMLVEADAPAGTVTSAFQTTLAQYVLEDGTTAHANTTPAKLPASLVGIVQDVLGLDTVTRIYTRGIQAQSSNAGSIVTAAVPGATAHNPTAFPAIYNVGNTPAATNITAAFIAAGNMTQTLSDLSAFQQQNGFAVPVSVVYAGSQGSFEGTSEWDLDSQVLLGMSGGLGQLSIYVATDLTWAYLPAAINAAVSANSAKVINMSFGGCEMGAPYNTVDNMFKIAIAQGQTFVAATGDVGSRGHCPGVSVSVDYPASSPYVVAVGGTTLMTDAYGGYAGETAWSLSGGGISSVEHTPSWQSIVPLLSGNSHRGLPDIAFDADPDSGVNIIYYGQSTPIGGTSLSAPLFAATWARMLSSCGNLGFAAPTIYGYKNLHPAMLTDVTSGSNGTYSAASGWDLVTGWGTPNISNMWAAVCPTGAAYYREVQQIYVGYLGRPIDPTGLSNMAATLQAANAPTDIVNLQAAYGTNSTVQWLLNGIESSPESSRVYPIGNPSAYVTALYGALVNRPPTSTELNNLLAAINNGTVPMGDVALYIMSSIEANKSNLYDITAFENKTSVAFNFTSTLTPATAPYFVGPTAADSARHMLQQVVTSSTDPLDLLYYDQPAYISRFQSTINTVIAYIVAGIPY